MPAAQTAVVTIRGAAGTVAGAAVAKRVHHIRGAAGRVVSPSGATTGGHRRRHVAEALAPKTSPPSTRPRVGENAKGRMSVAGGTLSARSITGRLASAGSYSCITTTLSCICMLVC